jgi:hypothetical protein
MGLQGGGVDLFPDGTETMGKELHGAQGQLVLKRDDLLDHIDHPNDPKQLKRGEAVKKAPAVQDRKSLRPKEAQRTADQKDQTPGCQPHKIALADVRHRKYLSM